MTAKVEPPVLKVVTVDDSPAIAQRLKSLLSDLAQVELLGNAEDIASALHVIHQGRPHVVFLDINLSHDKPRNGIDLLHVLRKAYPMMKLIMLTNMSEVRYREICKHHGADLFFDKSEDFDKIPETLLMMRKNGFREKDGDWWVNGPGLWS